MKSKNKFLACLLSVTTLFSSCPGFTTHSNASSLSSESKKGIGLGVILGGAGLIFAAAVAGVLISKNHKTKDAKTEENKQEDDQHNTVATNRGAQNNATRIVYFKKTPNGDEIKNPKYKYFCASNDSKVLLPLPQTSSTTVTKLGSIMRLRKNEIVQELQKLCSEAASCSESEHFVGESDIPQEILDRDVIDEDEEIKTIDRYPDIFYERYKELLRTMTREAEEQEEINDLVSQIKKICSFNGGVALSYGDQTKIVLFKSQFDSYLKNGKLNIESLKAALQNGTLDKNQLVQSTKPLLKIIDTSVHEPGRVPNPPFTSIPQNEGLTDQKLLELAGATRGDLVNDAKKHYQFRSGALANKRDGFIGLINRAKCKDGDINLSFQKSFFEQSFAVPYRVLDLNKIYKEWRVGESAIDDHYRPNCSLENKLKEIVRKWFGECDAETIRICNGREERVQIPVVDYIFDDKNDDLHTDRFYFLVNGSLNAKCDRFAAGLFVKILYSLEQEATRLNITFEDLNRIDHGDKKGATQEQLAFHSLWSELCSALVNMAPGCHLQVQNAIHKMAKFYDAYQLSHLKKEKASAEGAMPEYDRKFCQLLREEATETAVNNCPKTKDAKASVEFLSLIKSVFVPLVNVMDNTDYKFDNRSHYSDYGETYDTLAQKWKEAISSFDLVKKILKNLYDGIRGDAETNDTAKEEKEQFEGFTKLPMSFDEFVYIVKSINVKSIGKRDCKTWKDEISGLYKTFKSRCEADKDGYEDKEKSSLDTMGKWVDGKENITLNDLITLIMVTFCEVEDLENSGIYQLLQDADDIRTIAYIIHLARSGMIKING